ncbi:hypothetical protein FB45DRAFT_1021827 [Roridomyces roridus]|uniref:AB hydrolase-1 domain-containing protein n=1 Tax=Roridomyces roridus TaxID=1738132 RepID=A0AAD7C7B3_9AGAR|nr:hypothetical protein FB45DRAFT_1021827 [Roridomyces roridus]
MLLFFFSSLFSGVAALCSCSTTLTSVEVDVLLPIDPFDAFAGLKSNASDLRRLENTYNISGVFCRPEAVSSDVVQLLVHGITYNKQYWSPPTEELGNYSYAAFACDRGIPSLAVDWIGVGLTGLLKSTPIVSDVQPFKKVIAVGHSAGSAILNFDGIVFTGALIVQPGGLSLTLNNI